LQAKPKYKSSISRLLFNNLVASTDSQAKLESKSSITTTTNLTASINTSIAPTNLITITDETDGYANADAALAFGSILNVYKGVYFNVPIAPPDGVTVYYITRGRKIGVFSGW
jgi:hypothetical protein